jgi:hypothetical protein
VDGEGDGDWVIERGTENGTDVVSERFRSTFESRAEYGDLMDNSRLCWTPRLRLSHYV